MEQSGIFYIPCYALLNLDEMERNYKAVKFLDKWYVQYEYYNRLKEKWLKKLFKDWNREDLEFHTKEDADNWIKARIEIMNI